METNYEAGLKMRDALGRYKIAVEGTSDGNYYVYVENKNTGEAAVLPFKSRKDPASAEFLTAFWSRLLDVLWIEDKFATQGELNAFAAKTLKKSPSLQRCKAIVEKIETVVTYGFWDLAVNYRDPDGNDIGTNGTISFTDRKGNTRSMALPRESVDDMMNQDYAIAAIMALIMTEEYILEKERRNLSVSESTFNWMQEPVSTGTLENANFERTI